jgi:signal peptidase II
MAKPHRSTINWRDAIIAGIVLMVVAADQYTKWLINGWWDRVRPPNGVLWDGGFVQIINIHNTGAAFGIFQGNNLFFIIIYFVMMAVILTLIIKYHNHHYYARSVLARVITGLVLGCMIGNLIDRLRIGHVTDFIDFKIWPVFNVADSALTLALILIVVYLIINWGRISRRPT